MLLETNEELALSEAEQAPPPAPIPPPAAEAAVDDGLPYPPSPPEVDEEAEEERRFVPPFSLLDLVVLDKGDPGRGAVLVAEVLRHRGNRLVDATRLDGGALYEIYRGEDAKAWRMLQVLRNGKIRLFFREGDEGTVLVGGRKAALSSFCDDAHLFHKKRRIYALELGESDRAQLWIDGAGYFIRFSRAPLPPPKKLSMRVSPEDRRYLMIGVAGIVLMLAGIWVQSLLAPPELLVMEEAEFAEISLKDLEMEKPPEPPKEPEPVAEVQAPAPEPTKPAPAPPRPTRAPSRAARGNPQPSQAPAPSAADSALAALADIAPAGDTRLSAAVSNIAAVRAPSGTSSSFQVSGAIGKVPGDEVTLSRGGRAGGEGRETRAASAVLAGKSVGKVAGGGGTGRVRGTVSRQPARSVGTSGGSLDRGAILKVINENLSQVQSCYERQLISNPGLQGKIEFDWVIGTDGSVTSTRVNSSSLPSQAVANCIGSAIKTWRFPKPTGGSVSVRYPFVFSVQGF
ncbi:MAG TPA: AgmX/PglI C-terminal domain-containing protein [Vulgatibacter sp.]|nr:AgmX/PglI C-terminal domain-containing protein [Vulgatibacter sp.]